MVSKTTKQFPLSAFIKILVSSFFKSLRAFLSSFVMFLWRGNRARCKIAAVEVRIESFCSSGRWVMAASISETMFLYGIWLGVGANLGPFSRRERSAEESGFIDRLTTQFFLSIK